jgi:GNAT superfamily N-acetyltransferase
MRTAAALDCTMRPARPDDIPALNRLIARSARTIGEGYYSPAELEAAIAHVFGVDSVLIADGTYHVVTEADGTPIGCGGWSRRRTLFGGDQAAGRADAVLDPAGEPARIRAFFTAPEAARRGIGRALFDRCAADARAEGFRALALMATLPGVPFYAAAGYVAGEPIAHRCGEVSVGFVPMDKALLQK